MSIVEKYQEAIDEFKRVDHLYHVSLKYTRTVDVIRSVIDRLISTYENSMECLLECLKEEKKIEELPDSPVVKANVVLEKGTTDQAKAAIELYLKLRKLMRMPYTKKEEFRRHVTMIADFEGTPWNVDIDLLEEYYGITREFLIYLKSRVEPYKHLE